jgi:ribosomal subunit interface protein
MEATPSIKEFVEEKVTKTLSNYEGAVKEVDVTVSASGNHGKASQAHHQRNQKAEVTVYTLRHGVVRVEDTEDDLYAAVDLVMDKLKRKMLKVKEKAIQKNTWPGRGGTKGGDVIEDHLPAADSSMDEDLPVDQMAPEAAPEIVREKVVLLSEKMSPEEAAEQLEAVGHDFFFFVDAKDGIMKCVYRRAYHGYGLIIPQVA